MINGIKPNSFNFYVSLKNILRFFKYVFLWEIQSVLLILFYFIQVNEIKLRLFRIRFNSINFPKSNLTFIITADKKSYVHLLCIFLLS